MSIHFSTKYALFYQRTDDAWRGAALNYNGHRTAEILLLPAEKHFEIRLRSRQSSASHSRGLSAWPQRPPLNTHVIIRNNNSCHYFRGRKNIVTITTVIYHRCYYTYPRRRPRVCACEYNFSDIKQYIIYF